MAVRDHIHKLKKHKYKTGVTVFFCVLDCGFKVEVPFALGKVTACNICGDSFIMNEYTLKLVKPHCSNCGRREVKGPDGKKHYVRKVATQVLASVADNETASLKERLERATGSAAIPAEEEIL